MSARASLLLGLVLAGGACRGSSEAAPREPGPAAPASPATPAPPARVAPGATAPSTGAGAGVQDVVRIPARTTGNGDVFEVGQPRLRLSADEIGGLTIVARANRVFARDGEAIKVWDLATGMLLRRLEPSPDGRVVGEPVSFAASPDGAWLAMGYFDRLTLRKAPFDTIEFGVDLASPLQFSADSKLLTTKSLVPEIVGLAQRTRIATMPDVDHRHTGTLAARASDDGKSMYWVRDDQVARWDRATGTVVVLYKPPHKLTDAQIALRGLVAVVTDDKALVRIDLGTGQATPIAPLGTRFFAVSPSGGRVAVLDHRFVRLLDTTTGKEVWATKLDDSLSRIAFSEDENVFGVLDGQSLRVFDVGKGARTYPAPSRFAGWVGEGVAAIAHAGALAAHSLATRAWGATDARALAALAPTRPTAAPAWATWVSSGPTTPVVAEPSPRHGVVPDQRHRFECPPKLRVWTATGRVHTLALKPTDEGKSVGHLDPCWELAGGWVAGVTTQRATVFDPHTGKPVLRLDVGRPPVATPAFAHEYYAAALSPTGRHLVVIWRRADVWGTGQEDPADPHEDALHRAEGELTCDEDENGACRLEYFAELWSLQGTPARQWRMRFDASTPTSRTWPLAKVASGAVTFSHDGQRVLFGFEDGDIVIRSAAGTGGERVEHLHHAPITRIEVSPGDGWVFSEDSAGEQRLWQLSRP